MNLVKPIEIQNNRNWILVGEPSSFHWSSETGVAMVFAKNVHVNLFSVQNQILKFMSCDTGDYPFGKYFLRGGY